MKKSTRIISLSLSGLLVIGLLLSTVMGVKAAVTLTGPLAEATDPAYEWTVNGEPVDVNAGTNCINVTSIPCNTLAAGMLVTVVKDDTTNEALTITVLDQFEGTITALANGNTTWTVTDDQGNAYDFAVSADLWPLVFGVGDRVALTFTFVNGEFVASAVQVQETAVPAKTESARCTEDKSNQPALAKLAAEIYATLPEDSGYASVEELQTAVVDYFCKGFGVGEIKLAFKYATGSEYSAQMLLALRAQGSGWGQVKKLAKDNPQIEESTTVEPAASQNLQANPNKPDKALKTAKPDNPGKSSQQGKPDKPGKSGKNGKK